MTEKISIRGRDIEFRLLKSRRSKRVVLSVRGDARVAVSAPPHVSRRAIREFVGQKGDWLIDKLDECRRSPRFRLGDKPDEYREKKREAEKFVRERIGFFNRIYGFGYNKVSIRNQRTRWGSCSRDGNLNFNYKIIFLPAELADYIIVHELCHLEEFNHSARFWRLTEKAIAGARELKNKFKHLELT